MLISIDYVTYMLENKSCEILQDIIEKVGMNKHCDVKIARNFMKNQFKTSIMKNDDDCHFHRFTYVLTRNLLDRTKKVYR